MVWVSIVCIKVGSPDWPSTENTEIVFSVPFDTCSPWNVSVPPPPVRHVQGPAVGGVHADRRGRLPAAVGVRRGQRRGGKQRLLRQPVVRTDGVGVEQVLGFDIDVDPPSRRMEVRMPHAVCQPPLGATVCLFVSWPFSKPYR